MARVVSRVDPMPCPMPSKTATSTRSPLMLWSKPSPATSYAGSSIPATTTCSVRSVSGGSRSHCMLAASDTERPERHGIADDVEHLHAARNLAEVVLVVPHGIGPAPLLVHEQPAFDHM